MVVNQSVLWPEFCDNIEIAPTGHCPLHSYRRNITIDAERFHKVGILLQQYPALDIAAALELTSTCA